MSPEASSCGREQTEKKNSTGSHQVIYEEIQNVSAFSNAASPEKKEQLSIVEKGQRSFIRHHDSVDTGYTHGASIAQPEVLQVMASPSPKRVAVEASSHQESDTTSEQMQEILSPFRHLNLNSKRDAGQKESNGWSINPIRVKVAGECDDQSQPLNIVLGE